jgi:hypothetical protein
MDDETLLEIAHLYASRHALEIRESLGSGIHGIVRLLKSNNEPAERALKLHRHSDPYYREKTVYQHLHAKRVDQILGFRIPKPLRFNDEFLAIEMTIVTPPFILDFASARLNNPLQFSEEIWADWKATKQEEFGSDWPTVENILRHFNDEHRIQILDPSPKNIRFR